MKLTPKEVEELQEKLLIVHRFISQEKKFKNFYYPGIEVKEDINDDQGMVSKLMEFDDSEELLKNCIMELEDMKHNRQSFTTAEFHEFLIDQDWNFLYKKYGMKTSEDVGKLDLEMFLELL
jgi:hypothetical protein